MWNTYSVEVMLISNISCNHVALLLSQHLGLKILRLEWKNQVKWSLDITYWRYTLTRDILMSETVLEITLYFRRTAWGVLTNEETKQSTNLKPWFFPSIAIHCINQCTTNHWSSQESALILTVLNLSHF